MKLFVDTANLEELEACLKRGFPSGVTTNPAILSKEKQCDFRDHINEMIALLLRYDCKIPLSVEVFTTDPDEMLQQSEEFVGHFGHYPYLNVKVPIGWNELAVVAELRRRGIEVNCTCCMSFNQAVMAARAGANYVSLFWGRIRDIAYINEAIQAGAHILTVPPKFFPQMCAHPKTDEAVQQFVAQFQEWQSQVASVP